MMRTIIKTGREMISKEGKRHNFILPDIKKKSIPICDQNSRYEMKLLKRWEHDITT